MSSSRQNTNIGIQVLFRPEIEEEEKAIFWKAFNTKEIEFRPYFTKGY